MCSSDLGHTGDGAQGAQGITGYQGIQGIQGIQGAQGTQGQQGIQGVQGNTGIQGIQGAQGTQGEQGIQGVQGTQGAQGRQGIQGPQGLQGTQGIQGYTGIQGPYGSKVNSASSPPVSPAPNDFWWNADNGTLMVYYDDGNSQQWVSAISGITGIQGAQGASGTSASISVTDDTTTDSAFYPVFAAGSGTQTAKIASTKLTFNPNTGDITTTGNITAYFSDDRLKTRHTNILDALEKVNKLNGFYFTPNNTAVELGYLPEQDIGVSAQEVDEVLPEAVTQAAIVSKEEYLAVRYEK